MNGADRSWRCKLTDHRCVLQSETVELQDPVASCTTKEGLSTCTPEPVARLSVRRVAPPRTLSDAAKRAADSRRSAGLPLTGRAFGSVATSAANDLLQTVAEIVVSRARTKAMRFLADRVVDYVCKAFDGKIVLPRTCQLVRALRLEDLAAVGAHLQAAVLQDLGGLAIRSMLKVLSNGIGSGVPPEVATMVRSLLGDLPAFVAAASQGKMTELDAPAILVKLAGTDWSTREMSHHDALACPQWHERQRKGTRPLSSVSALLDDYRAGRRGKNPDSLILEAACAYRIRAEEAKARRRAASGTAPGAPAALAARNAVNEEAVAKELLRNVVKASLERDPKDGLRRTLAGGLGELTRSEGLWRTAMSRLVSAGAAAQMEIAGDRVRRAANLRQKAEQAERNAAAAALDLDGLADKGSKREVITKRGALQARIDESKRKATQSREQADSQEKQVGTAAGDLAVGVVAGAVDREFEALLGSVRAVNGSDALCAVRLALAVLAACQATQGCDARTIRTYLSKPGSQFSIDASCLPVVNSAEKFSKSWPDLDRFVARASAVLTPAKDASPRTQLRESVALGFDMVEHLLCGSKDWAACQETMIREVADKHSAEDKALRYVHLTRAIVDGALANEVQPVLSGAARLLAEGAMSVGQRAEQEFGAMARILGGLGSYAATYAGGDSTDPKQSQAQREARKKALESLIDSAVDRENRTDRWLVGLGGSLELAGGWRFIGKQTKAAGPWSLKLGVSLDLPRFTWPFKAWWPRNVHLQANIVDLANYLSLEGDKMHDFNWKDVLSPSLTVGLAWGSPALPWLVSTTVGYTPGYEVPVESRGADQSKTSGTLYVMFGIGIYVPLWDWN